MNSSVPSSIGVSPADLVYGQAINWDQGLFTTTIVHSSLSLSQGSDRMLQVQRKLLLETSINQLDKDTVHMSSRAATVTEFPINSFVLVD